jgi:hypothetical protein
MATLIVEKSKVHNPKIKPALQAKPVVRKTSKVSSIIVALLVAFIFGYIMLDYFVINNQIENKLNVINKKYDSLEIYMERKLPQINQALELQKQQVERIQHLKKN